ncbi:virion structural protein [Pseudomonas phage 201phi2-1]|uniref:Virion structural protein n=1 Tax=Pseudomonas phage 201phi2-1 TaxID=198110 RepID=B3FJ81_BP201|nr:virion structural protein [Pseudomonas phage 201phi2-1]ABY63048.1 virion structural protein [Pseudomonas phage 201phi2-1]
MIPVLQPLPIDWSGKSLHNRTKGEIHNLSTQSGLPYRIIVMERGYFYTDDLFMIDSRGYILKSTDYQCIVPSRDLFNEVKKTACAVILITNPDVGNIVRVDAQMVGGRYCSLNPAILETAINVTLAANRKIYWKDITDKPDAYRPNGHLHALWELFGFTEQTGILKRMTTAMDKIVAKEFVGLFDEFMIEWGPIEDGMQDVENRLTTHINDTENPHEVTADQAGLGNVVNGPVATQADAQFSSDTNRGSYTTPLRTSQSIAANFTPRLTEHINDLNNPHADTAAKLGTMTNLDFRLLANQFYNRGETVAATNRLQGLAFADYTNYIRTNIPVTELVSGILPQSNYVGVPQGDGYILQPSASGYMVWRPYVQAIEQWVKKGNNILYAGNYGSNDPAGAQAWLGSVLGTNHPNGTIAVYRAIMTWGIGTGNGAISTTVSVTSMAVCLNGAWTLSPGVYST